MQGSNKPNTSPSGNSISLQPWSELSSLTQGRPFYVERARLMDTGTAIEGRFEVSELSRLPTSDQAFVVAFIKSEGSIKELEKLFGVSYPTIKARLSRISSQLSFVETSMSEEPRKKESLEVLEQLSSGSINVDEALKLLRKEKSK
jgi:hypothetical protein